MSASPRVARRTYQVTFLACASLLCSLACLACLGAAASRPVSLPLLAMSVFLGITALWFKSLWRLRLSWPGWSAGVAAFCVLAVSQRFDAPVQSPATTPSVSAVANARKAAVLPVSELPPAQSKTVARPPLTVPPTLDSSSPAASSSAPAVIQLVESTVSSTCDSRGELLRLELGNGAEPPDENFLWKELAAVRAVVLLSPPSADRGTGAADRLRSVEIPANTPEELVANLLRELAKSKYWVERLVLPTMRDEWIAWLLELRELRELTVVGPHALTDAGLQMLCANPTKQQRMTVLALQAVEGNHNILGNESIRAISDLRRLEFVEVHSSKITGSTLDLVAMHCNHLRHLNLAQCAIDDTTIPHRWAATLQHLDLSGCVLQGDGLLRVGNSLKSLETLNLSRNRLDEQHLKTLSVLSNLRVCTLQNLPLISESLVLELLENSVQLRQLDLRGNAGLSEPDMERLRALAHAREIQLLLGPIEPESAGAVLSANSQPPGRGDDPVRGNAGLLPQEP